MEALRVQILDVAFYIGVPRVNPVREVISYLTQPKYTY